MSVSKIWLIFDSVAALAFGFAMFRVMAQSRPFRQEAVSQATTLKAAGIGILCGLIFLAGGALLGEVYARAKPVPGELGGRSILARVLIGAVIGGAIGATFYVALLGNLAVVFLDYHGVILYFTGAAGGCVGAVIGAIGSTPGVSWWIRVLVVVGAGLGGLVIGGVLGHLFIALFSAPFARKVGA